MEIYPKFHNDSVCRLCALAPASSSALAINRRKIIFFFFFLRSAAPIALRYSVSIRAWAHTKLFRQIVLTVTWTELKSSNAASIVMLPAANRRRSLAAVHERSEFEAALFCGHARPDRLECQLHARQTMSRCPIACADESTSRRSATTKAVSTSASMAMVVAAGTSWRSICNRFADSAPERKLTRRRPRLESTQRRHSAGLRAALPTRPQRLTAADPTRRPGFPSARSAPAPRRSASQKLLARARRQPATGSRRSQPCSGRARRPQPSSGA